MRKFVTDVVKSVYEKRDCQSIDYVLLVDVGTTLTICASTGCLLGQELAVEVCHEGVLVEVTNGQCHLRCHDDVALVHLDDALQVDNIGAMGAHEIVAGQPLLHFLHTQ